MMEHQFVFVCGLHRSGTSVFFRSLRDHPEMSGFKDTTSFEDEGMHLQTVYPPSGKYGGAGEFGFHREAHLTEQSPLVNDDNRKKLFSEWSPYWDLSKKFLLEKSPPNLIRTRFLQAMFPNSTFVVLLRHPLAVSYATQAWYRKYRINWRGFPRILEHWLVCHDIFLEDQKYLKNPPIIVKYEQFVANPEAWTRKIYDFLGVEDCKIDQKILSNVNEKYFNKWKKAQTGFFSGMQSRSLIRRFEDRFHSYGYSLVDLDYVADIAR